MVFRFEISTLDFFVSTNGVFWWDITFFFIPFDIFEPTQELVE